MNRSKRSWLAAAVAIGMILLLAAPAFAEDTPGEEPPWDQTFKGHEMWMTDLHAAQDLSRKENKPLLIDIYSLG